MSEDFWYTNGIGDNYERVMQHAGVKTTICKNRFEVVCRERGEINEQAILGEFKAWLAKRREAAMRDDGDLPVVMPRLPEQGAEGIIKETNQG
jgi:hypothetical protein